MAILILLFVLVGLGYFVARSGRAGYVTGVCGVCHRQAQVNAVTFRYNIGMLVARRYASLKGTLCKSCIHRTFWKYAGINVSVGWLGYISLFVAPAFLLMNLYDYLRSLALASPAAAADTGFGSAPPPVA